MKAQFSKIIILITFVLLAVVAGCNSPPEPPPPPEQQWPWTPPAPEKPPVSADVHYFVGKSVRARNERTARQLAETDGRKQCAAFIEKESGEKDVIIKGLQTKEYYTETLTDNSGREVYVVYALMGIDNKTLASLVEQNKAKEKSVEGAE